MIETDSNDRDVQIRNIIKSNLIGHSITPMMIDLITNELYQDLIDFLDNFYCPNNVGEEE